MASQFLFLPLLWGCLEQGQRGGPLGAVPEPCKTQCLNHRLNQVRGCCNFFLSWQGPQP